MQKVTSETVPSTSFFEPLSDPYFIDRARFLLQIASSLTIHDTLRYLGRRREGDTSSQSMQHIFTNVCKRKSRFTAEIQLSSAAFAYLKTPIPDESQQQQL